MMIKVCGITRREDAVTAAETGASALGFIFYPQSARYVTPEKAAKLGDGLSVWKVGVFVDESPAMIGATIRAARLDIVQIYGGAAPAGVQVWKAFRVAHSFDHSLAQGADAVLLDGASNGSSFDWRIAKGASEKVIVAGGLDASNVAEAIRTAQPWGVDASSRLETAPGIKSHEKVRAFIETARKAGEQTS